MSTDVFKKKKVSRLFVAQNAESVGEEQRDIALLKRLIPFMKPHTRLFVIALIMMPLASLAGLIQPWLVKKAVDSVVVQRSPDALSNVVMLYAGAIAVEFTLRFSQTYIMQLGGQRTVAGLRSYVFAHIQRLGLRYFDRTPVGRVVTRVTNDIDSLTELFASGAVTAFMDIITLAGIIIFMLVIDWQLSLITFCALPPLAIAVNLFRRWARVAFQDIRLTIAQLNAYLAEQVSGVAIVQAYGRQDDCADEYAEINAAYRDANYRSIRYDALLYSVVQSVSAACVALVLYFAAVRLGWIEGGAESALYVGTVVAFYDYIERFFIPVRDLATKYTIIQSSLASAERVFSLLDTEELDAPKTYPIAKDENDKSAITFSNLSFGYHEGRPVLEDVSFSIQPGERVAVVGATGSGKTTLLSLLLRLYELGDPKDEASWPGEIRVQGEELRSLTREALRRRFSVVPQDVFLFAGELRENLLLDESSRSANDDRIWAALEQVGAAELVRARGGLAAKVDDRGSNFSAGEKQLLAFARALLRDAPILLLDEATANVDSETEAELQEAAEKLLSSRTSLTIAHRLSTIERSDRILVMHRGKLVESGSHEELLTQDGVYARLHALQNDQ